MSDTITATADSPPPSGRPPMSTGDKVRLGLFTLGELLITAGLVVLLFVAYEVWVTNWFADRNNHRQIVAMKKEWLNQDTVSGSLPGSSISTVPVGKGLGILYIPRLGTDYNEAIVQGDSTPDASQLEQGTAHYGDTQLPGQVGNFAIAGHRVGKGEPFLNLNQLRSGDPVIVQTRTFWYVYRVLGSQAGGDPQNETEQVAIHDGQPVSIPGRQIIEPTDGSVLYPVPDYPGYGPSDALLTMTTCHPKFTASHRMVVFAKLTQKIAANKLAMPAAIKALYKGAE